MNVAILGTLARVADSESDDLQAVLEDQVYDGYMTSLDDWLLKEVFGG